MKQGWIPGTAVNARRLILASVVIASAFLGGCFRTELLAPNRISKYADRDITIVLLDKRVFYFPVESYAIVRTGAGPVIHGTGKEFTGPGRTGARMFTGTIPVAGIRYVETERKTAFYYIIPAAFIAGMVVYLVFFKGSGSG